MNSGPGLVTYHLIGPERNRCKVRLNGLFCLAWGLQRLNSICSFVSVGGRAAGREKSRCGLSHERGFSRIRRDLCEERAWGQPGHGLRAHLQ